MALNRSKVVASSLCASQETNFRVNYDTPFSHLPLRIHKLRTYNLCLEVVAIGNLEICSRNNSDCEIPNTV